MNVDLVPTVHDALIPANVRLNAKRVDVPVIGPAGLCQGRSLAICGSGPSLEQPTGYDEVWACNRAAQHVDCTHALSIEPSRVMLDTWADPPVATYFLATTVHPQLVEHVAAHGRPVAFFHSLHTNRHEDEVLLYARLFPKTALTHTGTNGVCRAVDLALWLGYARIDLYGCDMALGAGRLLHADGTRYEGVWWLTTEIEGRAWVTKPDMLYSAVDLVRLRRVYPERIAFVGDTLLRALQHQPDDVLNREWTLEERAA